MLSRVRVFSPGTRLARGGHVQRKGWRVRERVWERVGGGSVEGSVIGLARGWAVYGIELAWVGRCEVCGRGFSGKVYNWAFITKTDPPIAPHKLELATSGLALYNVHAWGPPSTPLPFLPPPRPCPPGRLPHQQPPAPSASAFASAPVAAASFARLAAR